MFHSSVVADCGGLKKFGTIEIVTYSLRVKKKLSKSEQNVVLWVEDFVGCWIRSQHCSVFYLRCVCWLRRKRKNNTPPRWIFQFGRITDLPTTPIREHKVFGSASLFSLGNCVMAFVCWQPFQSIRAFNFLEEEC